MIPNVTTPKNITVLLPHCPGESQASLVRKIVATIPKAEGLKTCLRFHLKIYFDATVKKAANKLMYQKFVLSNKHKLIALIKTLNPQRSKADSDKNLLVFIESAEY